MTFPLWSQAWSIHHRDQLCPSTASAVVIERHAFLGPDRPLLGLNPDFFAVGGKMLMDFNSTFQDASL